MKARKCHSLVFSLAAAAAVQLAACRCTATVHYAVADLGTLPGDDYSYAYAINNAGQVTGYSGKSSGDILAFLWENGEMEAFDTFGGDSSYGYGINNSGLVTGWSTNEKWCAHAFVGTPGENGLSDLGTLGGSESCGYGINDAGQVAGWSWLTGDLLLRAFFYDGEMIDLGTLGGETSEAWAINNSGQVVGHSDFGEWNVRAFLWQDGNENGEADEGEMVALPTLGGLDSFAYGINDAGQVVGGSETEMLEYHAFVYSGGDEPTDLGTLGGWRSEAYGINESAQVVGWSDLFGWGQHAFLWQDGHIYDLNDLIPENSGWELLEAWDINDAGQIVGSGTIDSREAAFLLTPFTFLVSGMGVSGENGISLSWDDLGDSTVYTVECCDSLALGNWSPVPPAEQWPITATNWTDDSVSGTERCFYRIKAEASSG